MQRASVVIALIVGAALACSEKHDAAGAGAGVVAAATGGANAGGVGGAGQAVAAAGGAGGTNVVAGTGDAGGVGTAGAAGAAGAAGTAAGAGGSAGASGGSGTLRFAVIGDYGDDLLTALGIGNEDTVAALVKGWTPDFIVTTGDNNYPDGAASTIDRNIGKYFAEYIGDYTGMYGPGSTENRFWPSLGNHDWQTGNVDAYLAYFTLPGNERYYDLDKGFVHFFFVDSEVEEPDGATADSVQGKWLQDVLGKSTACWDIVVFHRPGYSSAEGGGEVRMRWPFETWGADALLAGHEHFYERLQIGGIPAFISGNGGSALYQFATTIPESQARHRVHGAMLVTVAPGEITYESYAMDGSMLDTHTVTKTCP